MVAFVDYEKQAQEYYGKVPLIVLGSGASAAHGLSGMWALAQHLITNTDITCLIPDDDLAWKNFCKLLNSRVDLETALHQVNMSNELTRRIIRTTWSLINSEDSILFKDCFENKTKLPLGILLKHMFNSNLSTINIITTNYDRIAEYACEQEMIHHYSGFTHGFIRYLAKPDAFKINRKANIWKVHGSLDWFNSSSNNVVGLSNINEIPDMHEPLIVTPGAQKYQRTHLEPYRSIISNSDLAITAANSYLCIGYGFNDEHIQPKLVEKCIRQDTPITIITYSLSDSAKSNILNNKVKNYLAIERGDSDDKSLVYSSRNLKNPMSIDKNIWSLSGYLSLII